MSSTACDRDHDYNHDFCRASQCKNTHSLSRPLQGSKQHESGSYMDACTEAATLEVHAMNATPWRPGGLFAEHATWKYPTRVYVCRSVCCSRIGALARTQDNWSSASPVVCIFNVLSPVCSLPTSKCIIANHACNCSLYTQQLCDQNSLSIAVSNEHIDQE